MGIHFYFDQKKKFDGEILFTGDKYLATISSQLWVEAAGKSLSDHPGVGGQGLSVDTCVQDGGVFRSESFAVP